MGRPGPSQTPEGAALRAALADGTVVALVLEEGFTSRTLADRYGISPGLVSRLVRAVYPTLLTDGTAARRRRLRAERDAMVVARRSAAAVKTEGKIAAAAAGLAAGRTLAEVATEQGVGTSHLARLARFAGIEVPRSPRPPRERRSVRVRILLAAVADGSFDRRVFAGASTAELAREYGVSTTTLHRCASARRGSRRSLTPALLERAAEAAARADATVPLVWAGSPEGFRERWHRSTRAALATVGLAPSILEDARS